MIFELKNIFFILCVWVFWLHVCLCTTCVQCLRRPDAGSEWLGVGDTDSCEPLCRHWELNQSHLEEPSVLLTTKASPHPLMFALFAGDLTFNKDGVEMLQSENATEVLKMQGWKVWAQTQQEWLWVFPQQQKGAQEPLHLGLLPC